MTSTTRYQLSREGQGAQPNRCRPGKVPPVVQLPRGGRRVGVHRTHGEYDAQLTGRGRLSVYLSGDLAAAFTPVPAAGRGRPAYPSAGILIALVLRTLDGLALRQTQGRVGDLLAMLGHHHLPVPDHTTLDAAHLRTGRRRGVPA